MEGDDLCRLDEPDGNAVVLTLEKRYFCRSIYTWCGFVLLAVNPYEDMNIYGRNVMRAYTDAIGSVEPHIYGIAESSYQDLMINGDQTIMINGESGSGKTENTKFVIRYLLNRAKRGDCAIERLIESMNTVLEAFGNAKTKLNDNSSRFGKRIKLFISEDTATVRASLETYLLEKSRVTHQKSGEGNFHIFYQLCAHKDIEIKNDFIDISFGEYPSISECKKRKLCAKYLDVVSAMKNAGVVNVEELEDRILGILHLGFVRFSSDGDTKVKRNRYFSEFCRVYGFEKDSFEEFLVKHSIKVRGEVIEIFNTVEQAISIRNSVARILYSDIFKYIVECMNKSLCGGDGPSISVLDIFGFEVFENNGLDQLCINWTNERIQDEFIKRIFVEKQEMYRREGVSWASVEYVRARCISDIEGPCGLIELIDEESSNAWGCSKNLGMKIRNHAKKNVKMKTDDRVVVSHYAGDIEYDLCDFLDKNRERKGNRVNGAVFVDGGDVSLVKYFKNSMDCLFDSINKSQIKYVRCMRPNSTKLGGVFDRELISKQLVECGIVETIKIARLCFLRDIDKARFENRYGILRNSCVFERLNVLKGTTKMFVEENDLEALEACKYLFYTECCRIIRTAFRDYLEICIAKKKQKTELAISSGENGKNSYEEGISGFPFSENDFFILDTLSYAEKPHVCLRFSGEEVDAVDDAEFVDDKAGKHDNSDSSETIKRLLLKIEEYKRLCEAPCKNCKSLELKYKFQVEILKKKNYIESELDRYKARTEYLERFLREKDQDEEPQADILFINIHNVFRCLIQLYLEFVPVFSDDEIQRLEILSFAHFIPHIVDKTGRGIAESISYVVDEIGGMLHVFERDTCKVLFMLSNLIEYKSILHGEGVHETGDVENLISSLFKHTCELQRSSLLEVLPHSILEHQQLQKFRCHEGYFRKIFRPPSISKLVKFLEYFYGQMSYYYIPDAYITESVNYMLKTINTSVFNGLLVKKHFLSFNRRVQINYNVNEVGKFCRNIAYLEGMLNLTHVVSAIKLVSLMEARATPDTVLDECSILNSIQMNEITSKIEDSDSYSFGRDNQNDKFLPEPELFFPAHKETVKHSFLCPRYLPSGCLQSIFKSAAQQLE